MTNSSLTKLDKIKAGETCSVVSSCLAGEAKAHLAEMGVVHGANILVKKKAPLGDPIEIKLRDYTLCIRASEAVQINVLRQATPIHDKERKKTYEKRN